MNDSNNISLTVIKFIAAAPETVFKAWTDPALMRQWFCPGSMTVPAAEADAREGGAYRVEMKNSEGERFITYGHYREIIPNRKLVFTWGWEGPDRHETLVTVELEGKDNGTEVTLTHERFADQSSADHHAQGWQGCLENLTAWAGTQVG